MDLTFSRERLVAKDNRLIQHSRYALGIVENKAILYLISKIIPNDKAGKIYLFNCAEFQALMKWKNNTDTYNYTKNMLQNLGDMSWWLDASISNTGKDTLLRWFNVVRMDPRTGNIEISFQEDMFPYLIDLKKHLEEDGSYFTTYKLQNVILMKHKYSIRIYELLKSYQFNNKKWTFENGTGTENDIQYRIADVDMDKKTRKVTSIIPATWANWAIFKRDVLDPSFEEINKYTDIKVAFEGKKLDRNHMPTRAIRTIEVYMVSKTITEIQDTNNIINAEYKEFEDEQFHQLTIEEMFFQKHEEKIKEEKKKEEEKMKEENAKSEDKESEDSTEEKMMEEADKSKYPLLFYELNIENNANFSEKKICMLYNTSIKQRAVGVLDPSDCELFATDFITYYYDKIQSTPEDTKSSTYSRLLNYVKNDYDNYFDDWVRTHKKI